MTESSDINTFHCPTCGAPLTPPRDGNPTMNCPFCNNSVIVPADLRASADDDQDDGMSRRKKAVLHELMRLVGSGNKIGAIKLYRQQFDTSLAEAKQAIDNLEEGRGLELPEPADSAASPAIPIPEAPPGSEALSTAEIASRRQESFRRAAESGRRNSSCGGVFTLALIIGILAFIAAILIFSGAVPSSSLPAALRPAPSLLSDPAVLIAAEDAAPDVVMQGRRYENDPYTTALMRLSGKDGKILWEAAPFKGESTYLNGLITDDTRLYAVVEDELMVYQASTGQQLWATTLPDRLGYCGDGQSCMRVSKDVLLVLTADDTLSAYAAPTGKQLWNRSEQSSNIGILLIKGQVAAFTEDPQISDTSLLLLDLTTGQETARLTTDDLYSHSPMFYDESSQSIYLALYSSIEKWSLAGAKPERLWQVKPSEDYYPEDGGLAAPDVLYTNSRDGLLALDTQTGATRFVLTVKDYNLSPLAAQGNRLLVLAQWTRGTQRYELWGVDSTSGQRSWKLDFDKNVPFNDFSGTVDEPDEAPWLWRLRGGSLVITKFETEPDQITIETYNLADGTQTSTASGAISGSDGNYFLGDVIGWQGGTFWMVLESKLFAIDTEKGQVRVVGP